MLVDFGEFLMIFSNLCIILLRGVVCCSFKFVICSDGLEYFRVIFGFERRTNKIKLNYWI